MIYDVSASDADITDILTYSVSGTDASLVTIDTDDGEVRLKVSADYETKSSYDFTVIATDDGLGALSASKAVVLNISNMKNLFYKHGLYISVSIFLVKNMTS